MNSKNLEVIYFCFASIYY